MKWLEPRPGGVAGTWTSQVIAFHDLVAEDDTLLGYVREDKRPEAGHTVHINRSTNNCMPFAMYSDVQQAKDALAAFFVLQQLEDT